MSHFSVAVFHTQDQSIESLLKRYDENMKTEKRLVYTRSQAIEHEKNKYPGYEYETDEEWWESAAEGYETDSDGNLYTTNNPDAKWDWYQVGGRFSNELLLSNGAYVNSAKIKDIDFNLRGDIYKDSLRFWDVHVEHKPAKPDEKYFSPFAEPYYRKYYGTRENYAWIQAHFKTFAVVTPDGKWFEKGEMGWWGMSSETAEESMDWDMHYKERFIDSADPEWILTVVDCHI